MMYATFLKAKLINIILNKMKNLFLIALFLGCMLCLINSKTLKSETEIKIDSILEQTSFHKLIDEYTPSKYAKNLWDPDLEVDSLSVKVQLVRDTIKAVLDHLGFKENEITEVNTAKVSQLMSAMDLFIKISNKEKKGKDLIQLTKVFKTIQTSDMKIKLNVQSNVVDATEFIADVIHKDSKVNPPSRKAQTKIEEISSDSKNNLKTDKEEEAEDNKVEKVDIHEFNELHESEINNEENEDEDLEEDEFVDNFQEIPIKSNSKNSKMTMRVANKDENDSNQINVDEEDDDEEDEEENDEDENEEDEDENENEEDEEKDEDDDNEEENKEDEEDDAEEDDDEDEDQNNSEDN